MPAENEKLFTKFRVITFGDFLGQQFSTWRHKNDWNFFSNRLKYVLDRF